MPDIEEIVETNECSPEPEQEQEQEQEQGQDLPPYIQNFINNHLKDLTQIYINERKDKKMYGILLLEGNLKEEKVDVGFLPETHLEPEMLEGFKRRNVNGRIMHIMCHEVENPGKHFIIERVL